MSALGEVRVRQRWEGCVGFRGVEESVMAGSGGRRA